MKGTIVAACLSAAFATVSLSAQGGPVLPTASYTSYRASCDSSVGTPNLAALTLPRMGQTFHLQVTGLAPNRGGVLFFSPGDALWQINPLPFDLTFLGATGCFMNVDIGPENVQPFLLPSDATGTVNLVYPIPDTPLVLGFTFYNQYVSFDAPPARPLQMTTTNAGRGVVG